MEIFLIALALLKASDAQRAKALSQIALKDLSFADAADSAKRVQLLGFSPRVWEQASELLALHHRHGVRVIPLGSPDYPCGLERLGNRPALLFAKGNCDLLKKSRTVSIVGSRHASEYGVGSAKKIAAHFAQNGFVVVSGLAKGIDSVAHASCLDHGGETIAVLAHGLHTVYPEQNRVLAHRILDHNGLWVSEHPWGEELKIFYLMLRNRIQVGLSSLSILVEAKKKSGTMGHADYCLRAEHPLYVVLPEPSNRIPAENFEGNRFLFEKRGALPLRSSLDYPHS